MGSQFGPTLPNAFLCFDDFIKVCYRRYIDNIFVLFCYFDILNDLNKCHPNMIFSFQQKTLENVSFRCGSVLEALIDIRTVFYHSHISLV